MLRIVLVLACFWAVGCSCGSPITARHDSGRGADGGIGSGDANVIAPVDAALDANRPDSPAQPEVCDGVDNDHDGIVDNVDRGGDGVCDCLRIATLGVTGTAGGSGVFESWLDARSDVGADDLGDQVLTPELLAPYQIILAQNLEGRIRTADEAAVLEAWIRAGGGFMTLTGYGGATEPANVNTLLAPTGIQYGPDLVLCGCGFTVPVDGWHPHPISEMVTRLGIDNGYPVNGAGTVVADQSGSDVLRAVELGSGRVVVWGDEWISFDSEWTGHPDYQVERFWLNTIKWLSPPAICQVPILI
jgi:hypothetical protein